ncbi:MAG: hypothetical protein AAF479_09935, partial [Pseudomonadota bacterium]
SWVHGTRRPLEGEKLTKCWYHECYSGVAEGLEFLSKTRFDLIVYGLDREVAAACNTLAKLRNDGGANADSPILLLVNDRYPQEDLRDDCTLSIATIQKKPLMLSNLKSVATRLAESAHEDPLTRQR